MDGMEPTNLLQHEKTFYDDDEDDVFVEFPIKNDIKKEINDTPEINSNEELTADILKIIKNEPEFEEEVDVTTVHFEINQQDLKSELNANWEYTVKTELDLLHSEYTVKDELNPENDKSSKNTKTSDKQNNNTVWYYCANCNYKGQKKKYIENHVKTHFMDNRKEFLCEYCSKTFIHKQKLACHMLTHHREHIENATELIIKHRIYTCTKCNYASLMKYDLNKHLLSHGETSHATKLICAICNFHTYNKSNYSSHLRVHTRHRQFVCESCNCGFNRKSGLDGHILQKHKFDEELLATITSTLYRCGFCPMKFIKTTHLESHLKGKHKSI